MLEVRVLGPLSVRHNGVRLDIRGVRERAVLAALALRAPRRVTLDDLVDAAWGDDAGADPANTLQVAVSRLRRQLGDARAAVVTRGTGYALAVDPATSTPRRSSSSCPRRWRPETARSRCDS